MNVLKGIAMLGAAVSIGVSGCMPAPVLPDANDFDYLFPTIPKCQTGGDCPQARLEPDLSDASAEARDLDGTWQLVRDQDDYWRQLKIENGRVVQYLPDGPYWVSVTSTTLDGDQVVFQFTERRLSAYLYGDLQLDEAEFDVLTFRFSRISASELSGTYKIETYTDGVISKTLGPWETRAVQQ